MVYQRQMLRGGAAEHLILLGVLGLSCFAPTAGLAQSVADSDFTVSLLRGSPLALGGAYRALANDNQAIHYNPAGIAQNQTLNLQSDWQTSDYFKSDVLSGSAVDARAQQGVAYGIAYERMSAEIIGNDIDFQQFTLAVAVPIMPGLTLGASGKYYLTSVAAAAFSGPDGFTMDFGALWFPFPALSFAFAAQNMIEGTDNPNIPLTLSGGVAFRPNEMTAVMLDVVQDLSTASSQSTNFHFGGQLAMSQDFAIRSGYGWDRIRDESFLGTGILVTATRAWLGLTYARHFEAAQNTYSAYLELRI